MIPLRSLALAIGVMLLLADNVQATDRMPMTPGEVDHELTSADVVIRGKVKELSGKWLSLDVDEVLAGWYFGGEIRVIFNDEYDLPKCEPGDEVVICARLYPSRHFFRTASAGLLIRDMHGLWCIQSSYATSRIFYTRKELDELTQRRRVMK